MDKNLIDPSIYSESVEIEQPSKESSSNIERVLSNGIPLFSEEIGSFSSYAEKYFISTSNEEFERRLQNDGHFLNKIEWESIDKSILDVVKHLEVLSNVIFCISKAYCDNIQYINISQSYRITNKKKTRSLFTSEASKRELLLAISKRKSTLRPLIKEINIEKMTIPTRLLTHYEILNTVSELLPVWNISLLRNYNSDGPVNEGFNSLNLQVRFVIPSIRMLKQKNDEKNVTKLWMKTTDCCFDELAVGLSFQDTVCDSDSNLKLGSKYTKGSVFIRVPDTLMGFIEDDLQLNVSFAPGLLFNLLNETPNIDEDLITPPTIKSKLSRQIHTHLRSIHWKLIDRIIFHTLIQELIALQKEPLNYININNLDSNELSFSIDLVKILTNYKLTINREERFQNTCVYFKQFQMLENNCNSVRNESLATILLREAFLEIWNEFTEFNTAYLSIKLGNCSLPCDNSSKILDRWIYKLQKYANLVHAPLLSE